MIKAIIFDLDGTLLNTSRDIAAVLNSTLTQFSYPEIPLERVVQIVGGGSLNLICGAVGKDNPNIDEIHKVFCEKYAKSQNLLTSLYDGEAQTLTKLKSSGVQFAIVTNKPQAATDAVYAKYLKKFGFGIVLGQTEYYPLKPNPTSTLAVLDKLGVKKEECLFVGDGETDYLTAKAAGIKCVSALFGYRTRAQLEAVGAETFINNFSELLQFVINNN